MRSFDQYFSPQGILDALIRLRLKDTRRRHEAHFFRDISHVARKPEEVAPGLVDHLLPPRSAWHRPRLGRRIGRPRDEVTRNSIRSAVLDRIQAGTLDQVSWGRAFIAFCREAQAAVSGADGYTMEAPAVGLIGKPGKGNSCRVIAIYRRPLDRIVLALTAAYLRDYFDGLLVPQCHGFRGKAGNPGRHAVDILCEYRKGQDGRGLYVAECDIRKFFDGIRHDVVLRCFEEACQRRSGGEGGPAAAVDPRADLLMGKYLDSYDYRGSVLPEARRKAGLRGEGVSLDCLSDGELSAIAGGDGRVGIPQGGALSNIIANLVLDVADRRVLDGGGDGRLFYARFCDDMVVAHPDRGVCQAALARYMDAARELGLCVHAPVAPGEYGAAFFGLKSKEPYRWGSPGGEPGFISPWVSFLGYQVRHDGKLRIRRISVAKEKQNLIDFTGRLVRLIQQSPGALRKTPRQIELAFASKMISRSTGRLDLRIEQGGNPGFCWADAFYLLGRHPCELSQLRALDRVRERQFRRVRRRLLPAQPAESGTGGGKTRDTGVSGCFFGAPYSYFGRFGPATPKYNYRLEGRGGGYT